MKKRKRFFPLLLVLLFFAGLSGCGKNESFAEKGELVFLDHGEPYGYN